MELNIVNEVAALERLSVGRLRQHFAELCGETTKAGNRTRLVKRITWRLQALAEGDLSERARRRAAELARDADLRLNPPQSKTTATPPPPQPSGVPVRGLNTALGVRAGVEKHVLTEELRDPTITRKPSLRIFLWA
jgi:hypothetical protein